MRARRILLNDTLSSLGLDKHNKFDWDFMEVFVRGQNTPIQIVDSPFPELYTDLKGDIPYFFAAAKLYQAQNKLHQYYCDRMRKAFG